MQNASTSSLIEHLKRFTSPSIVQRGIDVYQNQDIDTVDFDSLYLSGEIYVQSSSYDSEYYTVFIESDFLGNLTEYDCSCPYAEDNGICKHIVAALIYIQENVQGPQKPSKKNALSYRIDVLNETTIKPLFNQAEWKSAQSIIKKKSVKIQNHQNGRFTADIVEKGKEFQTEVVQPKGDSQTSIKCSCNKPGCRHQAAGLLQVAREHGQYALIKYHNWEKEKAKKLADLGIGKELAEQHFEWYFLDGKPEISIKGEDVVFFVNTPNIAPLFESPKPEGFLEQAEKYQVAYGLLGTYAYNDRPLLKLNTFLAKKGKKGQPLKTGSILIKDPISDKRWLELASAKDKHLLGLITQLGSIGYDSESMVEQHQKYALFKEVVNLAQNAPLFIFTHPVYSYAYEPPSAQKELLEIGKGEVCIHITCSDYKGMVEAKACYYIGDILVTPDFSFEEPSIIERSGLFAKVGQKYYLWRSAEDYMLAGVLDYNERVLIGTHKWKAFFQSTLKPFINHVDMKIETRKITITEKANANGQTIEKRIVLSEMGGFLLLYPIIKYGDIENKFP